MASQLTTRGLAALKPGAWANDARPRGAGQLQARKLSTGDIAFYYRYTMTSGKQDRLPLGSGISLAQARDAATALSARYQAGERDLRAALATERDAAEAAANAPAAASLGDLLGAYVDSLRAAGKVSAGAVENGLRLHVEKAWPALWQRPARDLVMDDFLPVVATLVRAGTLREAGKLRSYLRAAYAAAIRARQDPAAPESLRAIGVTSNPVRDLSTIEGGNNARMRALTLGELRAFWRRVCALPAPDGPAMRFYLLTGGQRIAQLARLTVDRIEDGGKTIRLLDIKGRRRRPRDHLIPLIEPAEVALEAMRGEGLGPHLFTLTEGVAPASYDDIYRIVTDTVAVMAEAGELEGGRFTPGDLRRTIETRLAEAGQSDEARGHLQSHGLGGIQNRHYNRHRYDAEKRTALEVLHRLMTAPPATVTPLRAAAQG